jgi:transglutaminase-like putative cysteine protease
MGKIATHPAETNILGGPWYVFDPRNNMPRIGRVLIARGRDAVKVAISNDLRA